jgi:hypothetical protein
MVMVGLGGFGILFYGPKGSIFSTLGGQKRAKSGILLFAAIYAVCRYFCRLPP